VRTQEQRGLAEGALVGAVEVDSQVIAVSVGEHDQQERRGHETAFAMADSNAFTQQIMRVSCRYRPARDVLLQSMLDAQRT